MLHAKDFEQSLAYSRGQLESGAALESVLLELRQRGADKIDSIKIVKSIMHVSMAQAKSLVDRSETWSDRYANDLALHVAARRAAESLKNQDGGPEVVIEERSADPDGS